MVYLDFAKAFDKVDHGVLLHKLYDLVVRGKLGLWLHSFLYNREQQVTLNGTASKNVSVLSGVLQGSVLGPFLFLVLISDIDTEIEHSMVSSFADDTRVTKK